MKRIYIILLVLTAFNIFGQSFSLKTQIPHTDGMELLYSDWVDMNNDDTLDLLILKENSGAMELYIFKNNPDSLSIPDTLHLPYVERFGLGDFNNDGLIDVFIWSSIYLSLDIYLNVDGTSFTLNQSISSVENLWSDNIFLKPFDYDNDGDLDIVAKSWAGTNVIKIFENTNSVFSVINQPINFDNAQIYDFADINNDSYIDILALSDTSSRIFINNNSEFEVINFTEPNENMPDYSNFSDFNSDGQIDLIAGYSNQSDFVVYTNNNTAFTSISSEQFYGKGIYVGDFSNDGYSDYIKYDNNNFYLHTNNQNETFTASTISLPSNNQTNDPIDVYPADFDNDGDLDFFTYGSSQMYLYENTGLTPNEKPNCPTNLHTLITDSTVVFYWDRSTDNETTDNGLSYNIFIGTEADTSDLYPVMANLNTGFRRFAERGMIQDTFIVILKSIFPLECKDYFWSVQSIDAGFAGSEFAPVQSFIIPLSTDLNETDNIICGSVSNIDISTNYGGDYTLNYVWNTSTDLSDSTISNPTVNPIQTSAFSVIIDDNNGCIVYDTINIIVDNFTISTSFNNTLICGEETNLEITSNYTEPSLLSYLWNTSTGLSDSTISNPVANPTQDADYSVIIDDNNGCIAYDTVNIVVNGLSVDVGQQLSFSCGDSIQLNAVVNSNSSNIVYLWQK
jgi:hypothetical protein